MSKQEKALQQWADILYGVEEEFNRIATIDNAVSFEKEVKFALQALERNDKLRETSTSSVINSFYNVAAVGLTLNPTMKYAYLVPRDSQCWLDISAIGLLKLATDTGSVAAAKAEIVYQNDEFEYNGPFAKPRHTFNPFDRSARGEPVGVYVLAKLANGIDMVETLDMVEINKIKSKSKAKSGPWQEWFEEMIRKAGIKRAYKAWPRTERLSAAEAILNEHEGNLEPLPSNRVNGADVAEQAQEQDRAGLTPEEVAAVKKLLEEAADKGVDAYRDAWQALTKQQRHGFKSDHTKYKDRAFKAEGNQA